MLRIYESSNHSYMGVMSSTFYSATENVLIAYDLL